MKNKKESLCQSQKSNITKKHSIQKSNVYKPRTHIKTKQNMVSKTNFSSNNSVAKYKYHVKTRTNKIMTKTHKGVRTSIQSIEKAVQGMKLSSSLLCSIGAIPIFIIIIISLIGGFFMTRSSSSGEGNSVSEEVIAYTPLIQKYAEEYEIPMYLNVIQAVMMQESSGIGNDPIQSSKCGFNTKYPHKPNAIDNPEYSIQVGIQNLADCIQRSKCTDPLDMPKLSLALQNYNYGNGYIEWTIENFGGYSEANAKVFSDEQKRKYEIQGYGDPEYVPHVLRYYQFIGMGTSNSKLVNIALSQVGNVGGVPYWSWYGYSSHVEWCACFVSWCTNQSGDLNITIQKFSAVRDGVKWYKDHDKWKDNSYMPKSGDLIFFDWENDEIPNHVGIVEKVENNIIYTIEGNSNDACKGKQYRIDNHSIFGYGVKY